MVTLTSPKRRTKDAFSPTFVTVSESWLTSHLPCQQHTSCPYSSLPTTRKKYTQLPLFSGFLRTLFLLSPLTALYLSLAHTLESPRTILIHPFSWQISKIHGANSDPQCTCKAILSSPEMKVSEYTSDWKPPSYKTVFCNMSICHILKEMTWVKFYKWKLKQKQAKPFNIWDKKEILQNTKYREVSYGI